MPRPRQFQGSTGEEMKLAQLLNKVLEQELGLYTTEQLLARLRPEQFESGTVPSRPTISRYLSGQALISKGSELVDVVLAMCRPERVRVLREQVNQLLTQHHANPTELPPPTADELEFRIKALEQDLERARQDKEAQLRASDEEIAEIQRNLDELRPVDPRTQAEQMAPLLIELHESGQTGQLADAIDEFLRDTSARAQVALLCMLERPHRAIAMDLARRIGTRQELRVLLEVMRLLDSTGAGSSRDVLLEAAGLRDGGGHLWWFAEKMRAQGPELHRAVIGIFLGVAVAGSREQWLDARRIYRHIDPEDPGKLFLQHTAAYRAVDSLVELLRYPPAGMDPEDRVQLQKFIGIHRSTTGLIEIIDGLRAGVVPEATAVDTILRASMRERPANRAAELVAALRGMGRDADADRLLTGMGATDRFRDDTVAGNIIALRKAGQPEDADVVLAALARRGEPSTFARTIENLAGRGTAEDLRAVWPVVADQGWLRRWRLRNALRRDGPENEAKNIKAGVATTLYRAVVALGVATILVPTVAYLLIQHTELGSRADVRTVLSGDQPLPCDDEEYCGSSHTLRYLIEPDKTATTDYLIARDLRYVAAGLRVSAPENCPTGRSVIAYTLAAGDRRVSGKIMAGQQERVSLDTGGASRLTLRFEGADIPAGCRPTVIVVDPAVHRFPHRWLQRAGSDRR